MQAEKKTILKTILATALAAALVMALGCGYLFSVLKDQEEQSERYLLEVARQSAAVIEKQIEGDFNALEAAARAIGESGETFETLLPRLFRENLNNHFRRMAMIAPDGTVYAVSYEAVSAAERNVRDEPFFRHAMDGERYLDDTRSDPLADSGYINTYAVPIYRQADPAGAPVGVLTAVFDNELFRDALGGSSFNGNGFAHILKADGTFLMHSANENADQEILNAFEDEANFESPKEMRLVQDRMAAGESGTFAHRTPTGLEVLVTYTPVGVQDWYLFSVVPQAVVERQARQFTRTMVELLLVLSLLFASALGFVLRVRQKSRQEAQRLAYVDPVTGLYNKNRFRLEATRRLERQAGPPMAVMIFNLSGFRAINELFGFAEGDRLLAAVGRMLQKELGEGDLYARGEADNFYLLTGRYSPQGLRGLGEKLAARLEREIPQQGRQFVLSVHCGVYLLTAEDAKVREISVLLDRAKTALDAGRGGQERVSFYNVSLHEREQLRREVEANLDAALAAHEFVVYLQPQFSAAGGGVTGAEALVRWDDPRRGLLPPGDFIPVLEENGSITELDFYVLEEVCLFLREWLDAGFDPVPVSVNQSRLHLYRADYLQRLLGTVRRYGVPPRMIVLEITESAALDNAGALVEVTRELHDAGFRVSMDDFGSGYSSLNLLDSIPFDELKLDKRFFDDFASRSRGRAIVASVLSMAKELGISTVAEGIERKEQLEWLRREGCDAIQGFYLARPMPRAAFERLVFGAESSDRIKRVRGSLT